MAAVDPSSGHGDSTAGDSVVPFSGVISDIQESGSMELDPSTSTQATKEAEQAATLPIMSPQSQPVLLNGTLSRKHEMEGPNKKAANR